jgi:kinesin family protein 3/17
LHFTSKQLEQIHTENKRLKSDNEDLQHEFELDRQGYLNTIRIQERQLLLYRTMIEKMSGLMQRNCNYSNIEKIIEQARYDEEKNEYLIPDVIKEDVQFPQVGKTPPISNGRAIQHDPNASSTDYEYNFASPPQTNHASHNQRSQLNSEELERRYGRTMDSSNIPTGKIRNKRQEQLLNEHALRQGTNMRPLQINNTDNDYMNRRLNPFEAPVRLSRKYGFSTDKN